MASRSRESTRISRRAISERQRSARRQPVRARRFRELWAFFTSPSSRVATDAHSRSNSAASPLATRASDRRRICWRCPWPRALIYRRNVARRPHRERDRCFECKRFIRTGGIGRCDWCFERHPTALALRAGVHRVEYPQETVDAMPPALRRALEASPNRISASVTRRTASRRSPGLPPWPSGPRRGRR